MAELADVLDLGSSGVTRGGSSPLTPTITLNYQAITEVTVLMPVGHSCVNSHGSLTKHTALYIIFHNRKTGHFTVIGIAIKNNHISFFNAITVGKFFKDFIAVA